MKLKIFIKRFFESRRHFEKRLNKFLESGIEVSNVDRTFSILTYSVYYA